MYKIIIDDNWVGALTTLDNLPKNQVIDIAVGERYNGKKYTNAKIEIQNKETNETEIIDTTDDFILFGKEYAPGW